MPGWLLSLIAQSRGVWTRARWKLVWDVASWLVRNGRNRLRENLSKAEQQRFWELIRKATAGQWKTRPWRNLSASEQKELRSLIGKAITGDGHGKPKR